VSMDVTFREFVPYYTNKDGLDQFLEEFSSVTKSDSREGENDYEHSSRDNDTHYEIVGTISSSNVDDVVEENEVVIENERSNVENNEVMVDSNVEDNEVVVDSNVEDNEVAFEDERSNVENNEVVVVGTIPCPTNLSGGTGDKKGKTIVYQRRWFKNQGEQIEQPQPQ
jgi:hypothetical protein